MAVLREESRKKLSERLQILASEFKATKVDPVYKEFHRIDSEEQRGLYREGAGRDYLAQARESLVADIDEYYSSLNSILDEELSVARNVVAKNKLPAGGVDWTMRLALLQCKDNPTLMIEQLKDSAGSDIGFTELMLNEVRNTLESHLKDSEGSSKVDERVTYQLKQLDSLQSICDLYSEQHQVDALESIKAQVTTLTNRDSRDSLTGLVNGLDSEGNISIVVESILSN